MALRETIWFDSLPTLGVGCDVIATSTFFRAFFPLGIRDFAALLRTTHSDARRAELRVRRGVRGDGVGPVSYTHLTLPTKRIV